MFFPDNGPQLIMVMQKFDRLVAPVFDLATFSAGSFFCGLRPGSIKGRRLFRKDIQDQNLSNFQLLRRKLNHPKRCAGRCFYVADC